MGGLGKAKESFGAQGEKRRAIERLESRIRSKQIGLPVVLGRITFQSEMVAMGVPIPPAQSSILSLNGRTMSQIS